MPTDLAMLELETMIIADVLSVALDLASQVQPQADSTDDLARLQSLLLLARDRAEQAHQRVESGRPPHEAADQHRKG
jgi:hypothetical protein